MLKPALLEPTAGVEYIAAERQRWLLKPALLEPTAGVEYSSRGAALVA